MLEHILLSGLTVGAIYALIACGFTVVFAAMRIINFAHGEFVMAGGMFYACLTGAMHMPAISAFLLSLSLAGILAYVVYEFALGGVAPDNHITQIMVTLGVGVALKGLIEVLVGKDTMFAPPFTENGGAQLGQVFLSAQVLWIIFFLLLFLGAYYWLLRHTRFGGGMRAASMNHYAAVLMGISTKRVAATSFVIAGVVGAAAGSLMVPLTSMHYDNGMFLAIKGFAAAILGGLGSPAGALAGGLIIGLTESLAAGYISSVYKDAVALGLLLLVLLFRPQGLFGMALPQKF